MPTASGDSSLMVPRGPPGAVKRKFASSGAVKDGKACRRDVAEWHAIDRALIS